jgi:hypothetical protein
MSGDNHDHAKAEQQRKLIAQMADEIERIRREDWKPPHDAPHDAPLDIMPLAKPIAAPAKYTRKRAST